MSDRLNTIFGWTLFAGIVALMLRFLTSLVMPHEERPETLGYFIEGAEEEGEADSGPPLATLLAAGSAELGATTFAKCATCHTVNQGGANGIGPNLYGIMGKPVGSHAAGFAYSSALAEKGGTWDYETMSEWLANPRAFASGTKMAFAGLSKPEERANVMLYLLQNGGGPPLPEAPAEEAAEGVEDPAAGPGAVEGGAVAGPEAAGAMADEQPVAGSGAAVGNVGQ